jgi:glycosyltransferase involved in cell wall biosynthesis
VAEPRTVLYVDHASGLGGAEHSLLGLLGALDRVRWRPVLAAPPGALADAASGLGLDVRRLPLARLQGELGSPWRLSRGLGALRRVVAEEQAALLHGNVLRASVYAALAAQATGRPLVWHVRDLHRRGPAAWWLCRRAAAVVAISAPVAAALPCAARARIIDNPVAPVPARPRSRAELGLPPEGPLVAMAASLRRWKGHPDFLAMAALAAPRVPAQFVVIGGAVFAEADPGYAEELAAQAAGLGLGERLRFLGQREDLADLWPHLALLVHPARAEPFGRVMAEALVAGVPVVAWNAAGAAEIVQDGQDGLLVPPGDLAGLAEAVVRLLEQPDLRAALARAGQARARRRFAPAAHARAVEAVYDAVLAGRGRSPTGQEAGG